MTFNPLEMIGFATLGYIFMTSLQTVLFKYGYARGKEEAQKEAAKAEPK